MINFQYNGISSDTYNIVSKSVNRTLLPALRKREMSIPGRHGVYDFGGNKYDNRIIVVEITYIGASFNNLRLNARNISSWLSQTSYKQLIFSDEPDKYYLAKIYDSVGLENLFRLGKASLQFECKPHALSVNLISEVISI